MFGDFGKMMKMAVEMKRKMPELQAQLESSEHTAEAGGGTVRATVNGKFKLLDVKIDPSVLADGEMDVAMLEDLIKAAVSAAQAKAAEAAAAAMAELTGGMPLPGLEAML
jgi:DNA-binding YbaB/EbfC family protein